MPDGLRSETALAFEPSGPRELRVKGINARAVKFL